MKRRASRLSHEARLMVIDRLGREVDACHAYARLYPDLPEVTKTHRECADFLSHLRQEVQRA